MEHEAIKEEINRWYTSYSNDIYQYIFFLIGDSDKAKDIMQDTFVRAYDSYESFHWGDGKGWLFRIARNIAIDYMRKEKPITYLLDLTPFVKGNSPNPEEALQFSETEKELYGALNKLKKSYRDVILLRKIKEFSIEETGEILGWKESKVKSNLFRGLRALKKQLEKEGYSHDPIR